MKFRRSSRLLYTLSVVGIVLVGVAFWPQSPVLFAAALVLLFWIATAAAEAMTTLIVDEDILTLKGYKLGRTFVIHVREVDDVQFRRYHLQGGRAGRLDLSFITIRSTDGTVIPVFRYGWGRKQRQLFQLLSDWLRRSGVSIDDEVTAFLRGDKMIRRRQEGR